MKAIGIDLGTTNSVVSVYEKGVPRTIEIYGHRTTPSVVSFDSTSGKLIVGHSAKKRVLINPELSIVSNKRFMGDRDKVYTINKKKYTPVDIASFILKYLVEGAAETLNEPIKQAVITVPAYFNQNQKEDTKRAAEKAGLEVLMLQAEPTAAALAYGFNQGKNQVILVYDLGGGTFDISILEVKDNKFIVRAVGGDARLGGDTLDEAVLDHIYAEINQAYKIDLRGLESPQAIRTRQQLVGLIEQAKIELSAVQTSEILLPSLLGKGTFEYELKRKEFNKIITPTLVRTIQIIHDTLRGASLTPEDINRVVCVGGSTKIPLVTDIIENELKSPFRASNVDEIVASGAAITAQNLLFPIEGLEPVNVTPFNLGIRLDQDRFGILIPKNSQIPATVEKEFTTYIDNATETEVEVFQGENLYCSNNTALGGFSLKGIQKAKAGVPRIRVKFTLDKSDILLIEARDLSTNKKGILKIERFESKPYVPVENIIRELKIGVSRIGCDDMGKVLSKIKMPWTQVEDYQFSNRQYLKRFNVLFINCSAGGSPSANKLALNSFVKEGGVLYVSDLSAGNVGQVFPGKINFGSGQSPQRVNAKIVSSDLSSALGKNEVRIHFDLPAWIPISSVADDVDVFMTAKVGLIKSRHSPIMAGFSYGAGYVIYTSFHNHALPSKDEEALLKAIALKPVSVATKTPLTELFEQRVLMGK